MTPNCPTCADEGVIYVMGESLNPFNGIRGPDPQVEHQEPCPDCYDEERPPWNVS